jgi:RNA 3'-phosphate cyclase
MIKIDGSHGEGGGQIVRTALAMSALLQKAVEITNIRQGRSQPGLKAQHLTCLKALQQLCGAKFNEVDIGTTHLRFIPGEIKARKVEVDIGTAGSITLLLQSLLVPCFFAGHATTLKITGGTSGKWQMPFDYFNNVFIPQLRKYAEISTSLNKRGYYPKGGGLVEIKINPLFSLGNKSQAPKINLAEQGNMLQVKGISHASIDLQDANVAERQAESAKLALSGLGCNVDIRSEYCNTLSTGTGICLWAVFAGQQEPDLINPVILGSDVIGEKGKPAEEVGSSAAKKLIDEIDSGAAVDENLADNLIPFLALFGGRIKVSKISSHAKTNIYVAEQFLGNIFEVNENENLIISNPEKEI